MTLCFDRGVALPQYKMASYKHIADAIPLTKAYVPLSLLYPSTASLQKGDALAAGTTLHWPTDSSLLPSVSPVSGVVGDITHLSHPLYGNLPCYMVEKPSYTAVTEQHAKHHKRTAAEILEAARHAAIVDEVDGLPLCEKLKNAAENGCELLVADASDAQSYTTSAQAVLFAYGDQANEGLQLAAEAAGAAHSHLAVPRRRRTLASIKTKIAADRLYPVSAKYPPRLFPDNVRKDAVTVVGVQACLALYRAVCFNEPQTSAVITVAGDAIESPQNIRVPFGATLLDVVTFCGLTADPSYILMGDIMTGFAAETDRLPVLPGVTCVLAFKTLPEVKSGPCIGCGRCAQVCHRHLLPFEIVRRVENSQFESLATLNAIDCDGCGACSYVCPAGREVARSVLDAADTAGTITLEWGDEHDA